MEHGPIASCAPAQGARGLKLGISSISDELRKAILHVGEIAEMWGPPGGCRPHHPAGGKGKVGKGRKGGKRKVEKGKVEKEGVKASFAVHSRWREHSSC